MKRARLLAAWLALTLPSTLGALDVGAQEVGAVGGRVLDQTSTAAVAGVVVRIDGTSPVLTNDEGFFVLRDVPAGPRELVLEHLAYGTHTRTILVEPGGELALDIVISSQAVTMAPLVVEVVSELELRRVSSGHVINEIVVEDIDRAAVEGLTLTQLLQSSMPGVQVQQGPRGQVCITYRAIRTDARGCNGLSVVLDGVPLADPSMIDGTLRLADIERVEVLSPGQAGVRYGMLGGQSVLVVETKRGTGPARTDLDRFLSPFDWAGEERAYPWVQVFGSAFLANALGVGVGLLLAERCFSTPEEATYFALRTRCDGVATLGTSLISVGLPAFGGSVAARWGGRTSRSHGRVIPSMIAAGMILTGGYLMVIEGSGSAGAVGGVVLAVGAPVVLTLSDRVFRILR